VIGRNPQKEETVIWVVKKDPQISQKEEIVIWVVILTGLLPPKSGKKRNGEEARFSLVTVSGNFHNKRSKDENDDEDSTCHGEAKNEPGWQETVGPVEP